MTEKKTPAKRPTKKSTARRKTPYEKDWLQEAFTAAKARMILAEQQIEAFHFLTRNITSRYNGSLEERALSEDTVALRAVLYQRLTTAQRDVMTFGSMVGGEAEREAKYMAYVQFLNERYSIMHLLNHHGGYEGSWNTEDEKAFKAQIKAAVTCTDPDHDHRSCNAPGMVENIHDLEQQLLVAKERYEAFVGELTTFDRPETEDENA